MKKPLRLLRLRLVVALVVAMIGAIAVQQTLTEAVRVASITGDSVPLGAPFLYVLILGLAYWIAPKWG